MLFVIIVLLVFITQSVFAYWWLIAVDAFLAALFFGRSGWGAFLSGFLAVALVWFGQAYYSSYLNENLLLGKITQLFRLPASEWMFVIVVSIGGLVGGLAALSGYSFKALWQKER